MIPIQLKMRNFMCYRGDAPPLQFNGIHTACICGDNGNGKSALIDAMTWALWGRTRAKNDDDLIHTGQNEVQVDFDFAAGQQHYRIIRKHARPRKRGASGPTILEFQIATANGFKSITAESVLQTQQKIIGVLHMDYETFINSAFLRQGHADEFTIKRPVERKQVLADILGLYIYDELEEQAKGLAKEQELEKAQLDSAINDITLELAHKPTYQAEFALACSEVSCVEELIKEQEAKLRRLREDKESLENKRLQAAQLVEHIEETKRALQRWDEQARQHQARLTEFETLLARRPAIEEGYARFAETKKLVNVLDQKLRQATMLTERRHRLEMAITQASQSLVAVHHLSQSRINELEAISQRLPGRKKELGELQLQWRQLTEQEETLRKKKQSSQELQSHVYHLESGHNQLKQELQEIGEKLNLLTAQSEARCPLCERELGIEGLKLIQSKYAADKLGKSEALKSNETELAHRKAELVSLEKEISNLEAQLSQYRASLLTKIAVTNREITEAEEAIKKKDEERKKLEDVEQRLARRDFTHVEQEALKEVEGELVGLGYSPSQHEEARRRLGDLEQYETARQKLEEADRLINQEREALSRSEEAIKELNQSLETDTRRGQELALELDLLPRLISDLAQAEMERQALAARLKQAQETMGSAKGNLERCGELEVKKKEKEKLLEQAAQEEKIYRDLAQAFGKRGIQALLIEMALPEIEVEANRLLSRMTDNRMHVKIETQRETKKGDLLETLDIRISDGLETRNYEMFSGGEAFRINFAIRIALSKLLARRAGAPLPTLIIDEGFGTQDSAGIEKLKEAINSIQDDFEKILVITHIEELKDAFPARISVMRTAEGSTLSMS